MKPLDRPAAQPAGDALLAELLAGLEAPVKRLPAKWFYDARGSELFDAITRLPEYYLTRTERAIVDAHLPAMARTIGPRALLIEPGSAGGEKAERLLAALEDPVGFVPIEVSGEYLAAGAARLAARFPALEILPMAGDFTRRLELPRPRRAARRSVVFFPGSTLGNFSPDQARRLLERFAGFATGALIGIDLRKDPALLLPAYDDAAGVTAEFNLNMLARLNREYGADFKLERFRHRARWNDAESRIEMHLESLCDQRANIAGRRLTFRRGETIHTEDSYKYAPEAFAALAARAGWGVAQRWVDADAWFSVLYLERR